MGVYRVLFFLRLLFNLVHKNKYRQLYFAGSGPCKKKLIRLGSKLPNPPVFGYYNRNLLYRGLCMRFGSDILRQQAKRSCTVCPGAQASI